jgi:hypothetical protein
MADMKALRCFEEVSKSPMTLLDLISLWVIDSLECIDTGV